MCGAITPDHGWGATEKPGPGLRLRQAVALAIYAAALLLVLLLPLGVLVLGPRCFAPKSVTAISTAQTAPT